MEGRRVAGGGRLSVVAKYIAKRSTSWQAQKVSDNNQNTTS